MFSKTILIALCVTGVSASSLAAGPTLLGQISLDYLGQSSNNGTFEWQIHNTTTDVFTYCFSTNNDFSPSENPQVFDVWSIAGATAAQVTSSGMLNTNTMTGLTTVNFLEAAAQAVSLGTPGIVDPTDTAKNDAIHNTESNGNPAFSAYDNLGTADFYYLEQINPLGHTYPGQPQGLVSNAPPPTQGTPEPASLAALGVGAIGLLRRRRAKA